MCLRNIPDLARVVHLTANNWYLGHRIVTIPIVPKPSLDPDKEVKQPEIGYAEYHWHEITKMWIWHEK